MKLLLPLARFGRGRFAAAAGLALLGTICQLLPYWAVYRVLGAVVAGDLTAGTVTWGVAVAALGTLGMTALLGAATWMSHRAAFATLEHLRLRIGQRLGEIPLGHLTLRRSGQVQRVLGDDVERLESFLAHAIPDTVSSLSVLLGTTVWLLAVDWRMGLSALSVVLVALPLMVLGAGIGARRTAAYGAAMSRMSASVVEFVRGQPVVRMFHRGDVPFPETAAAIRAATDFQAGWGRRLVPLYTAFYTLLASNIVVIAPTGLLLWSRGRLGTADLIFFLVVGLGYTSAVMKLLQLTTQLGRLGLGAADIHALDRLAPLPTADSPAALGPPSIEVRDVRFAHTGLDGRRIPALDGVSFVAPTGTMTAVVGPSGAGKSTLAALICRFWDADAGSIRVCGADVRDMPFDQLMGQVAFVLQDTFLFDDTVAANLRLARPDAGDGQLVAAARAARAHDFVTALTDGYHTRIGPGGNRLSGGERQRLSIARALLRDAPVIVLDEATAYVDPANEAALQDALTELVRGRTLLVIAHRLSTVAGADQILVLEHGRLVERGRHDELRRQGGLYSRLWAAHEGAAPADATGVGAIGVGAIGVGATGGGAIGGGSIGGGSIGSIR